MIRTFDYFNRVENPQLILLKINRDPIADLKNAYSISYSINLGSPKTLTFSIPKVVDGVEIPFYNQIEIKNLINFVDLDLFMIDSVSIESNGVSEIKNVSCSSYEIILGRKSLVLTKDAFPFYNFADPYNEKTILGRVCKVIPDWNLGTIDPDIPGYYNDPVPENAEYETRYFDVSEQTVYNFLLNDVANAYECIFEFDNYTKTINAVAHKNVGQNTNIFLSHDNLILTQQLSTDASEVVTALACIGGNNLDISMANPNDTKYVFDFSYYKNLNYITQTLKDRLDAYDIANLDFINKTNISGLNPSLYSYTEQSVIWKTKLTDLALKEADIRDKQSQINAKEEAKAGRVSNNLSYTDLQNEINILTGELNTLKSQRDVLKTQADAQEALINTNICNKLKLENFFSPAELQELSEITYYSTYQNDAYRASDYMTDFEKLEIAERLYRNGLNVLALKSHPLLQFSISSIDFTKLPEFQAFTQELNVGDFIRVEYDNEYYDLRLLTIENNVTEDNGLTLTFANRYKRQDGVFNLQEILNNTMSASTSLNFNKVLYENWGTDGGYKNAVADFVNNGLDASINNVKTSINNDILIDGSGIRCRKIMPDGSYDNAQLWIVNNQLVFSDDGFETAKLALGEIRANNIEFNITSFDDTNKTVTILNTNGLTIGDYIHIKRTTPYTILFNNIKVINIVGNIITLDTTETITTEWNSLILEGARTGYGLIADYVIGTLLAGNKLTITNEASTFTVDSDTVTIDGASLIIKDSGSFNDIIGNINAGINQVFYQNDAPTTGMAFGDFWIDINGHTPPNALDIYRYEGLNGDNVDPLSWQTNTRVQSDPLGLLYLNNYNTKTTAEKSRTYVQDAQPTSGMVTGDLWLESDNDYKIYRYDGIEWKNTDNSLKFNKSYDSVIINDNGLVSTSGSGASKATVKLNATDGFSIYKGETNPVKTVGIDINGDVYFKGIVDASDYKIGGASILDGNNKIQGGYISAKGISVSDGSKTTFSVDSNGNVTISGNISMTNGSINWTNVGHDPNIATAQNTANSAYNIADGAADAVYALGSGSYSGTFINNRKIFSPEIYANTFTVQPDTLSQNYGGFYMKGYWDNMLKDVFELTYFGGGAPLINFNSPLGAYAHFYFPVTYFENYVYFRDVVDFGAATVEGLTVKFA